MTGGLLVIKRRFICAIMTLVCAFSAVTSLPIDGLSAAAGNQSVAATASLPTVTGFSAPATSARAVKLTWNKVNGAQGYIVYRYEPAKKIWLRLAKTNTTANVYLATGLNAGTTYMFAVKPYKTVAGREITSAKYPTVTTSTVPAKVSFTVTTASGRAVLKWTKAAGVSGYIAYYKTSANGKWRRIRVTTATSCTKTGLINGKTYWFTVKAYRIVGGKIFGGIFEPKSAKIAFNTNTNAQLLAVSSIYQYGEPSLPTGCESTSLAIALNYYGANVTKNEIADKYISKGNINWNTMTGPDPLTTFIGNPNDNYSYGCYSTCIQNAANKYIKEKNMPYTAKAVVGKELSYWFARIRAGHPVVIWATMNMAATKKTTVWHTTSGKKIQWLGNEHCLVLAGYDLTKNVVYVADPMKNTSKCVAYDIDLFAKRYAEQGKHAVVIIENQA